MSLNLYVVLKLNCSCDGCIKRIYKTISKTKDLIKAVHEEVKLFLLPLLHVTFFRNRS
ncbi:unnamed protein product [Arabidopsis lyrata]|uniref:HMA domain-containing protein n=1 Tax=Arabidopsis thaliana x Arabidopsis arenosa TaxID=1240361 RepID=A0A8T2BYA1_9BRAS|nr:hypothetical protein ISN45_Aa01g015960 [Arabidopsis thaliana x Arabidopsis arenosa]CAH8259624.1 unnamed protein product [Arabidopsis lyrata]